MQKTITETITITSHKDNPVLQFSAEHWRTCRNDVLITMDDESADSASLHLLCDACRKGMTVQATRDALNTLIEHMRAYPAAGH